MRRRLPARPEVESLPDQILAHLIAAHRLAEAMDDGCAVGLVREAMLHVGRTYAPTLEDMIEGER